MRDHAHYTTLTLAVALLGAAGVVRGANRTEPECRAVWTQARAAHAQALVHLASAQLTGKMSLRDLRQALGEPGEGMEAPEGVKNAWRIDWLKGPIDDVDDFARSCRGYPEDDPTAQKYLKWSGAVQAVFPVEPGKAPSDGALPVQIKIVAPFPGRLLGLRIGDADESLKKRSGYAETNGVGAVTLRDWNVRWTTKDGHIEGWIRADDSKWKVTVIR
jgi:hypothetical protein